MENVSTIWDSISFDSGTEQINNYISSGGEIYYEDNFRGWCFLNLAAHVGNKELIEKLLHLGYDVNHVPSCGNAAIYEALDLDLDSALQKGTLPNFDIVNYLFSKGAKLDLVSSDGRSLLDYCDSYGPLFREEFEKKFRIELIINQQH
jgi:ankyrin repeat protein